MFCKLSNFDNLCLQIGDLNSIYEEVCARSGDVDERDFFDKNGYLLIPFNEEPSEVGHGRYKRSYIYPTSNFFFTKCETSGIWFIQFSAGTISGGTTNTAIHDEFQPVLVTLTADLESRYSIYVHLQL